MKLTLKTCLKMTLAVLAILFCSVSLQNWLALRSAYESIQNVHNIAATKAVALEKTFSYMMRERLGASVYSFAADEAMPDQQDRMLKVLPSHLVNIDKYLAIFESIKLPDEDGERLSNEVVKQFHNYLDGFVRPTFDAVKENDLKKMKRLQLASTDGALQLNDAVAKFNVYAGTITEQMLAQAQHDFVVSEVTTVAALGTALVLFALIYAGALRAVLKPLNEAGGHFDTIASGNLSAKIVHNGTREMRTLFEGLQKMQASLSKIVTTVRSGAIEINVGVAEIVAGNNNLSARTEQQAASLEETAASMEQLTATVKQNSESAAHASSLTSSASEVAARGNKVVGRVVETMLEISTDSSKISDITGIIEGIAFQTNILALNAAVEAARAGEQGRGFAVVAGEVRILAQRSSSAAKEIKELILMSVSKIQDGSTLAGQAGQTMSEVTIAVAKVNDIIIEIATASGEQRQGIEQVNAAITQMDGTTQHNAALVEEATAASQALEEQGRRLTQAISSFNLGVELTNVQVALKPVAVPEAKRHTQHRRANLSPIAKNTQTKASSGAFEGTSSARVSHAEWESF